jgi:hypothetical protein
MVKFPGKIILLLALSAILLTGCTESNIKTPDTESNKSYTGKSTTDIGQNNTSISSNSTPNENSQEETGTASNSTVQNRETVAVPKVKALYLTGWTVGSSNKVKHYIDVAKNTEINSYVIDIKDDDGYVGYESSLPEVVDNGAWKTKYNPDYVIKQFHSNNVHIIGRIVCFKDPIYSIKRPDLAIKNINGGLWKDNAGRTWLNPYNKDNWAYLVNIAKEAVGKGFDEIQFDYVRFPSDGKKSDMDFKGMNKEKYQDIGEFLSYAKKELPNIPVSADVFGIIFESPNDTEHIGQYLEYVGKDIDYISPMVYPSHYAYGQIVNNVRFPAPDLEPYKVVYNTLTKGKTRLSKVTAYRAKVRPYLQDFTATWLRPRSMYQNYGVRQVEDQIKAVYDAGYEEWILWDASNHYHEGALKKEK